MVTRVKNKGRMPSTLPRFAESFRVLVDHPEYDTRMLTSEWEHASGFLRFVQDFLPHIARAGRIGFIASTVPALAHHDMVAYYGEAHPPMVVWWWRNGAWECKHTQEAISAYCRKRGIPITLFTDV